MKRALLLTVLAVAACGDGDDSASSELTVTWKFESGDCASNAIEKVRVTVTPRDGAATTKEVACTAGTADAGPIGKSDYNITGEGLDASGKSRFLSQQTAAFPDGKVFGALAMTLRAKPSNVTVTWNGCPPSVVLPYRVTLYKAANGAATAEVAGTTDASCSAKTATIENVQPGDYIADVDSRAVTPAVKGQKPVTVTAGDDATVAVPVP